MRHIQARFEEMGEQVVRPFLGLPLSRHRGNLDQGLYAGHRSKGLCFIIDLERLCRAGDNAGFPEPGVGVVYGRQKNRANYRIKFNESVLNSLNNQ